MADEQRIPLERIRTDGWFERLGESIGSFHTLCDVLGQRFFAFALIAGARVSSLMIDRFNPDQSLVEFSFGGADGSEATDDGEMQRFTVLEFRQRLVSVLLEDEPAGPSADEIGDELEALQKHIGPRALLLAPLYGYGLKELVVNGTQSTIVVEHAGQNVDLDIPSFRMRLLEHVQEDLDRGVQRDGGTAIDLNNVDEAEKAAKVSDWNRVLQLLGSWPMPLAIYWRTPEGQMLPEQAKQRIAQGLGLLGTACAKLGDQAQGEEVLRLAVQYAQDGPAAAAIFTRLGLMFMDSERHGEAIGPLRRARALGGKAHEVLLPLATAFLRRKRHLAAYSVLRDATRAKVAAKKTKALRAELSRALGEPLHKLDELVG